MKTGLHIPIEDTVTAFVSAPMLCVKTKGSQMPPIWVPEPYQDKDTLAKPATKRPVDNKPLVVDFLNMSTVRDSATSHFVTVCHELVGDLRNENIVLGRTVRVRRLHYGSIGRHGLSALIWSLHHLVYLEEICIALVSQELLSELYSESETFPQGLLQAIRDNGSLKKVEIDTGPDLCRRQPFLSDDLHTKMLAYTFRNQSLSMLINPCETTKDQTIILSMYPMLFAAAKQAKQMAPHNVLRALMAAGVSIGPWNDWFLEEQTKIVHLPHVSYETAEF